MKQKKEDVIIRSSAAEYLTYIASIGDDETVFEVRYQDENIWLTQKMLAVLYDVLHYSLQMIIAVGFKVDSERAVQFRKWVNQIANTGY